MSDNLTPEEEMQQRYHNVFTSREGLIVIGDIAKMFHFFDAVSPDDIVGNTQRSCALVIMQMAGVFDQLYNQLGLGSKVDSA